MTPQHTLTALVLLGGLLSACGQASDTPTATATATATVPVPAAPGTDRTTTSPAAAGSVARALPQVTVHKSPSCGCCSLWVGHLERAGFPVSVVAGDDLNPLKHALGVPAGKGSCHTALVEGYFIEGHVPVADIQRLLAERPAARGLTVPGMPMGSPGMEVPSGEVQPYTVFLVDMDGNSTPYSHHGR